MLIIGKKKSVKLTTEASIFGSQKRKNQLYAKQLEGRNSKYYSEKNARNRNKNRENQETKNLFLKDSITILRFQIGSKEKK